MNRKDKENMTEKRNQRQLLWFQTGGTFNFINAAPHCGDTLSSAEACSDSEHWRHTDNYCLYLETLERNEY
jgi:hypothetical protein